MSSIIAKVLIMRKLVIFFAVVWIALIVVLFSGCTHIMKERSTSKMANLNISVLRDRNISINLVEYRDVYEDDPRREAEWKLLIFAEEVGFRNGSIVLVTQDFYLVDGGTLIHICPVSDEQTTNDQIMPYLQAEIDRATLLN